MPGLSVGLLADLILLEFLVQIAARRADHLGGLRDVPPVLAELADEEHPFGVLFELSQRPRLPSLAVARLLRRGKPGPLPSPQEAAAYPYTPQEREFVDPRRSTMVLGEAAKVRAELAELRARTGAGMFSSM